jgi:hypothetical protein
MGVSGIVNAEVPRARTEVFLVRVETNLARGHGNRVSNLIQAPSRIDALLLELLKIIDSSHLRVKETEIVRGETVVGIDQLQIRAVAGGIKVGNWLLGRSRLHSPNQGQARDYADNHMPM